MTTLPPQTRGGRSVQQQRQDDVHNGSERREYRRFDVEQQSIRVERWDGSQTSRTALGDLVDLSAGGVRLRTKQANLRPNAQIRVRLELPAYAGICPFVDTTGGKPVPKREWVGWMSVARVQPVSDREYEIAGRLIGMEDMDRGMLGLYLSAQPLAA